MPRFDHPAGFPEPGRPAEQPALRAPPRLLHITTLSLPAQVVKTWSSKKEGRKRGVAARAGDKLRQAFSTKVILMWTAYMLLLW